MEESKINQKERKKKNRKKKYIYIKQKTNEDVYCARIWWVELNPPPIKMTS